MQPQLQVGQQVVLPNGQVQYIAMSTQMAQQVEISRALEISERVMIPGQQLIMRTPQGQFISIPQQIQNPQAQQQRQGQPPQQNMPGMKGKLLNSFTKFTWKCPLWL